MMHKDARHCWLLDILLQIDKPKLKLMFNQKDIKVVERENDLHFGLVDCQKKWVNKHVM